MDQCISLLAPHLAAFREQSCADAENASFSSGAGAPAGDADEIPPQLLRVARFFRWRWEPLKRALLRPPTASVSTGASGQIDDMVEVGSARHRLRLARALHARGLLSLAEVDGLASSIERQENGDNHRDNSANESGDDGDGSNHSGNDLTARLRLALSRLPADVSGVSS